MSWLNLLWMLVVVAFCSWFIANLLVLGFTPILRSPNPVGERRHLVFLAALPWVFPLLAIASLMLLALAKIQGWIHHHCVTHQAHHPHFCLEHLPEIALQTTHLFAGIAALIVLLIVFLRRMARHYRLFTQSRLLRQLVQGRFLKNTLAETRPLAFTLGIRRPLIFISQGLYQLLSKRQLRIVVEHEVAHIRTRDVLKNTLFEILLGIHIAPGSLRSRWHFTSEIRADDYCVKKHFDSAEIAEVLIMLHRAGVNSPFPVSVAGGVLPQRIDRLLNQYDKQNSVKPAIWLFYLIIAAFPVALVASHHGLETLWGWLL